MPEKPTYEELEKRVRGLDQQVAEYKRTSEMLRQSEERFRSMAEASHDLITIADINMKPLWVNRAWEDRFGPLSEYLESPPELIHPDDMDKALEAWNTVVSGQGLIKSIEYRYKSPSGEYWTFDTSIYKIPSPSGERFCIIAHDVTERKQAEETLRESEHKYRLLVENANEAILVAQDGFLIFTNEKGEDLFAYSMDELASRPFTDFIHEEDRELVIARHERRLKGEILPDIYAFKIICKTGEVKWVELKVTLFSWEDKPATLCFFTDITEQQQVEKALRESEEKYRNLFNAAQVGLARTQISDGKVLECNQKLAEIFGFESIEDFNNEWVFSDNYVDPHLRERMLKEVKKTGILNNAEAEFYAKDKSKVWARFDTRIVPEKGYMENVVVDITEQKAAETALRESEEKYRCIFENSIVGFFQSTPEGRFISVNSAFAAMLRYESPDELVSKISDIATQYYADPEDRRRYKELLQKSGAVMSFEFKVKRKDGSQIWVSNSTRAYFNQDGTVDHYEGIVIDITELKRAREEKEKLISELQAALADVKTLSGFLPICSYCKKVRDDEGYWSQIESYIHKHSEADFSHSICPECAEKHYPDFDLYEDSD